MKADQREYHDFPTLKIIATVVDGKVWAKCQECGEEKECPHEVWGTSAARKLLNFDKQHRKCHGE